MVASRMVAEPNAAFAGMMFEASSTRLRVSMAIFNEERAPPCPIGCWGLSVIVETQGGCVKVVRRYHREGP